MYIHIYRYIDIYIGFETKMQKVKKKHPKQDGVL